MSAVGFILIVTAAIIIVTGWSVMIEELIHPKLTPMNITWKLPFTTKRIMAKVSKNTLHFYLYDQQENGGVMVQLCNWSDGKWQFRDRQINTVNEALAESKLCRYVDLLLRRYSHKIKELQINSTKTI